MSPPVLLDRFRRAITYLRLSVTDRCDLRCVYCMAPSMRFLPKSELLSLEELDLVCSCFVRLGVRKLRITGGEPLVRRGIMGLFKSLSRHLSTGMLDELTLTTNGSRLAGCARSLYDCGVRRVNVSLDTLDAIKFKAITRGGRLEQVMDGIAAAQATGLRVKINTVALRGINEDEIDGLITWCGQRDFDLTLIEVMPMGELEGTARFEQYLPLSLLRGRLQQRWHLTELDESSGGPARYVRVEETLGKLGFITPLTHNFCESCNRVRLTCTGILYMCLGQQDAVDLRSVLRQSSDSVNSAAALDQAIREAIQRKPRGHDFVIDRTTRLPAIARHMNVTGG